MCRLNCALVNSMIQRENYQHHFNLSLINGGIPNISMWGISPVGYVFLDIIIEGRLLTDNPLF
jgi:hypothetical protein